jgi:hypothetical protein
MILGIVSAEPTAKRVFSSISWMIDAKRTCAKTRALFSLRTTCYLMAWLAKVSRSKTEPQGNRTAKSTLEFYSISTMFRTIRYAKASSFRNTRAAN